MQKSRGRPEPVSCQSCRSKKLKCNRVQPCANCSARGITCSFLVSPTKAVGSESTAASHSDLQERVQRLEAILLTPTSDAQEQSGRRSASRNRRSSPTPGSDPSNNAPTPWKEYQVLEDVATREDAVLPNLSNGLNFLTRAPSEILRLFDSSTDMEHTLWNGRLPTSVMIILPDYSTAAELFRSYEGSVDHVCRILHVPTVRASMKTFYLRLAREKSVTSGQAALYLSIFAIASFFFEPSINSRATIIRSNAPRFAKIFGQGALDALDHSRRNTSCTLEDVQAHTIMSLLAFQLDGFSARGRLLSSTALSIARDLRFHQLDASAESSEAGTHSAQTLIDSEVKRRVFWYLVSTDWLLSAVSGPQEGTYSVLPNHIHVRLPRDCTDDELLLIGDDACNAEQPTGVTYLLYRVKLAHICREMVDMIASHSFNTSEMPYDQIIAADKRLVEFISSVPFFFQTDPESRARTVPFETLNPALPLLRYSINQAAHSRRCRLHQRYLFRQSVDPRYSYSRRACLESARAVIHSDQDLICPDPPWVASARRGIATHFKHLATVVLVMDLCFNPSQPDTEEVKADVKGILDRFEEARHVSPLLGHFLGGLCSVLRKHDVSLDPASGANEDRPPISITLPPGFTPFTPDVQGNTDPGLDHGCEPDLEGCTGDCWLSCFEDDAQIDLTAWSDLFSSLDSRPL